MVKLMMAVVWLSGQVDHVELKGSDYKDLAECQYHVRQMTFTNYTGGYQGGPTKNWSDLVVGGGFYCEVQK